MRMQKSDCRMQNQASGARGALRSAFCVHRSAFSRPAYSFAEVLFAVAVLGIGFIMVAAIFPVAIQQTQLTLEETVGTATARNGMSYIQGSPYMTLPGLPFSPGSPAVPAAPTP